MVRVRLAPSEDVRRSSELAGGGGCFNRVQPRVQLLIKVAAFGQRPVTNTVEDLASECETFVEAAGGGVLLQTSGVTAEYDQRL